MYVCVCTCKGVFLCMLILCAYVRMHSHVQCVCVYTCKGVFLCMLILCAYVRMHSYVQCVCVYLCVCEHVCSWRHFFFFLERIYSRELTTEHRLDSINHEFMVLLILSAKKLYWDRISLHFIDSPVTGSTLNSFVCFYNILMSNVDYVQSGPVFLYHLHE